MSGNIYDAGKRRVFPNGQLVVRHAVARDELAVTKAVNIDMLYREEGRGQNLLFAPLQAGNLAASVNRVNTSPSGGVPKVDITIMVAAASSEEIRLPRAPRESLDGRLVVGFGPFRSG